MSACAHCARVFGVTTQLGTLLQEETAPDFAALQCTMVEAVSAGRWPTEEAPVRRAARGGGNAFFPSHALRRPESG